jgi:hypothetical protein
MCIEKNYSGAYVCSDIVNNIRIERKFYGFTKRQAQSMFREVIKELK